MSQESGKHIHKVRFVFIFLVTLCAPVLFFYFNLADSKSTTPQTINTTRAQASETDLEVPQYTFYTRLPKMEVPLSERGIVKSQPARREKKRAFILQISALQNPSRAFHLRNQLAQMGYQAFIESYETGETTWYRVLLGPYDGAQQAQAAQKNLKQQHFNSILLQLKGKT